MDSILVESRNSNQLQRQLNDLGFDCVQISPIHSKYRKLVFRQVNYQIPL